MHNSSELSYTSGGGVGEGRRMKTRCRERKNRRKDKTTFKGKEVKHLHERYLTQYCPMDSLNACPLVSWVFKKCQK
jgi:hypothetical protein